MNIIGFIKKYGNRTFREMRLGDVDALIFSELAYVNFELIMEENETEKRFSNMKEDKLNDKNVYEGSVDAKKNKTLLNLLVKSNRYKNVIVRDVVKRQSKDDENQFYVVTFVLPNGNLFISYRGTDTSLIGWKEDFLLTVYDKIKAQIQAEKYLASEMEKFPNHRFYLGGHSKGGNLAFYAALTIPDNLVHCLIGSYSFDGPGFKDGIKGFRSYNAVKEKLIKYRTFNNVIGAAFTDVDNYRVVYSIGILGGHDSFGWRINKKTGHFRIARDISNRSKIFTGRIMRWLESLSKQDRLLTVEAFFRIFDGNDTIYDLFHNFLRNVRTARKTLSVFPEEDRARLKEIMRAFFGFLFREKRMRKISKKEMRKNEIKGNEGGNSNE